MRHREKYNEYMRTYMLRRYHRRRQEAIEMLGGACVDCGSMNDLEFDHADRTTKSLDIAKMWSYAEERWKAEVSKCVLRCKTCHGYKTIIERGMTIVKGRDVHGTLSSWKYCKCDKCRGAYNTYMKQYKKKRRAEKQSRPVPPIG